MMRRVVRHHLCAAQPARWRNVLQVMPTFHPVAFKYDKFLSIKTRTLDNYTNTEHALRTRWATLQSKVHQYNNDSDDGAIFALPPSLAEELGRINRKTEQLYDMLGYVLPDDVIYRSFHNNIRCGAYSEAITQWLQPHILDESRGPPYPLYVLHDMTFILQHFVLALLPSAAASLSFRSTLPSSATGKILSLSKGALDEIYNDLSTLVQSSAEYSSDDAAVRAVRAQLSLAFTNGVSDTLINEPQQEPHSEEGEGDTLQSDNDDVPRLVNTAVYTRDLMSRYYTSLWRATRDMQLFGSDKPTNYDEYSTMDGNEDSREGNDSHEAAEETRATTKEVQMVAQTNVLPLLRAFTTNYTPLPHTEGETQESNPITASDTSNETLQQLLRVPKAIAEHYLALAQCAAEAKEVHALYSLLRHFCSLFLTRKAPDDANSNQATSECGVTLRVTDWCTAVCTQAKEEEETVSMQMEELEQAMRTLLYDFADDFLSLVLSAVSEVQMEHQLWQWYDVGHLIALGRQSDTPNISTTTSNTNATHREESSGSSTYAVSTTTTTSSSITHASDGDEQRALRCAQLHTQLRQQVMQRIECTNDEAWQDVLQGYVYHYLTYRLQLHNNNNSCDGVNGDVSGALRACLRSFAMIAQNSHDFDNIDSKLQQFTTNTTPTDGMSESAVDALEWQLCMELIRINRTYAQLTQHVARDEAAAAEEGSTRSSVQVDWAAWGNALTTAVEHYISTCKSTVTQPSEKEENGDIRELALQHVQQLVELMARILVVRHATRQLRTAQDCIIESTTTTADTVTSEWQEETSEPNEEIGHTVEAAAAVEEEDVEGQPEETQAAVENDEQQLQEEEEDAEAPWLAACQRLLSTSPNAEDTASNEVIRLVQLVQSKYEEVLSRSKTCDNNAASVTYAPWQCCLVPHTLALLSVLCSTGQEERHSVQSPLSTLANIACAQNAAHIAQPLQFGNSLSVVLLMLARAAQWPACAALLRTMREANPSNATPSLSTADAMSSSDTQSSQSPLTMNTSSTNGINSSSVSCVTLEPGVLVEVFRRARAAGAAAVCAELRTMRSQLFF